MENYNHVFHDLETKIIELVENSKSLEALTEIKNKYLSKKGEFSQLMSKIREAQDKKAFGEAFNNSRKNIEEAYTNKFNKLNEEKLNAQLKAEEIDISLPGNNYFRG